MKRNPWHPQLRVRLTCIMPSRLRCQSQEMRWSEMVVGLDNDGDHGRATDSECRAKATTEATRPPAALSNEWVLARLGPIA